MTSDPATTADRVLNLFNAAGQTEYHGEQVSQLEHALQAAHLAGEDGWRRAGNHRWPSSTTSATSGQSKAVDR